MTRLKLSSILAKLRAALRSSPLALAALACLLVALNVGSREALGHASIALPASSPISSLLRPIARAEGAASGLAGPAELTELEPPTDLSVTVRREDAAHLRVVVRRRGHLVVLRAGELLEAGQGTASIRLDSAAGSEAAALTWETTSRRSLEAARGTIRVALDASGDLRAAASLVDRPEPVATLDGHLHSCAGYRDGSAGFTVICKLKLGAWRVGAVNVTGEDPHSDVWVIKGLTKPADFVEPKGASEMADSFVRLDIPLAPGAVEARLIGYVDGITGVVLRAEASRLPGEEPSLVLAAALRVQSFSSSWFGMPRPPRRLRPGEDIMDLDWF